MKIKKSHISLLGLFTLLLFTSCGDFLEETSQDTDYVRSWRDLNELLIGSAYLPDNGANTFLSSTNYGTFIHLPGDEMTEYTLNTGNPIDGHDNEYGYFTWQQRVGQNQTYTDFFTENTTWTKLYNCINVCNNILNSVKDVPNKTQQEQQGVLKVSGEAHFLRAYYYFWLVNVYGKPYDPSTAATDPGVPIKTTSTVEDKKFTRNTVQEAYDLVLSDLKAAEEELGGYHSAQPSIYRADSVAVHLLLSRVYLYMQNWSEAARYAQKVVNEHPALQNLNNDTSEPERLDNPENIFSMGGDDVSCMMNNGPQSMQVNHELYQLYSNNDLRRRLWYWTYASFVGLTKIAPSSSSSETSTSRTYYYYRFNTYIVGTVIPVSSVFWMRSAEAYLNLAEAEAYMGNEEDARRAINTLRAARFTPSASDLMISSTGSQLINDIRKERRMELAFEGHRWFDLRRYRVCSVQPSKISITHDFSVYQDHNSTTPTETRRFILTQDDNSWTLPIPNEVLEFNTGMENNPNQWRTYTVIR